MSRPSGGGGLPVTTSSAQVEDPTAFLALLGCEDVAHWSDIVLSAKEELKHPVV